MRSLPWVGDSPVARGSDKTNALRALASNGFRPFFLLAGLLAVLAVPTWLVVLKGSASVGAGYLEPITWHAHEMVFGFTSAVIAGFLLTAVRSWTGRETATGGVLYGLAGLWLLGRVVLVVGLTLPKLVVALVDLAFLPAVALAIALPIFASGNKRSYVMLGILGALTAANLAVHLEVLGLLPGWGLRATHASVNIVVLLAAIISGRVIPMFTRNATDSKGIVSVKALDVAATLAIAAYAVLDLVMPWSWSTGVAAAAAAVLIVLRAARWGGFVSLRVPLLWILHFGHAWIAVGLALRAAAFVVPSIPLSAGTHALTVGAIGSLTLGMMARVSLGHTGRPLVVGRIVVAAFMLVTLAACVRVFGPIASARAVSYSTWLVVSGVAWTLAFTLFVLTYAKILASPRVDGKPG